MNTKFSLKALAASTLALAAFSTTNAQISLGTECGCPDLADRSDVNLSTLATGDELQGVTNLTCDNVYFIDDLLYVPDGAELFVEPGTVFRGVFGEAEDANALVVARGGKIFANGNAHCPIIFTDENDPLDGTYSINNRGNWGSLIILGRATNNLLLADGDLAVADGVGTIEGLVPGDSRNHYGAAPGQEDDDDSSGVLRYVSLRHGGTDIGDGNEINGLTLGSVGRGTVVEHVEVVANDDDGVEWFGGTVDCKYLTVLFCNDDYFDWDQGWSGRAQYLFGVMLPAFGELSAQGDEGFEVDGDDQDSENPPLSNPTVYNATIIGRGANRGVLAKENTQGEVSNSIFANFPQGVDVDTDRATDAYNQWLNGDLVFQNNSFAGVDQIFTVGLAAPSAADLASFTGDGNQDDDGVIDFSFTIDPTTNAVTDAYNPVPALGQATSSISAPNDGFFDPVQFRGAFKPGAEPWTAGWTLGALLESDNSLISCPEDINGDGTIDVQDFLDLNSAFGTDCGI
jgi:hypothetical protein